MIFTRVLRGLPIRVAMLLVLLATWSAAAPAAQIEERERVAEQIVDAAQLDRLMLAMAQARLAGDAQFQSKVDYFLYRVRPPALWNDKHPAWAPARAALLELARPETARAMKDYWPSLHPLTIRELHSTFMPPEEAMLLSFVQSTGGKAWFARRLAELRAKNGPTLFEIDPEGAADLARHAAEARRQFDALPPAEKKNVEQFLAGAAPCTQCARPVMRVLERFVAQQVDWLVEVLTLKFGSSDWRAVDGWKVSLDTQLASVLPVDSKKQVLGVLELRADGTLAFRITYYWKDRSDGGVHVLEFPRGHPNYAEVSALAPGLAVGKPRQLYRDESGVIGDQP